jgi:hypothetical protein
VGSDPPGGPPKSVPGGRIMRGVLNAAGGAIPFIGGFLAAAAGAWSEHEQEEANSFFRYCIRMLEAEMAEKAQTIVEVMARLDMHDEKIAERVRSAEFQSLVRKALRDWAGSESEEKRGNVRNILANAAASTITSDDVVRLFLEWLKRYSDLHFHVIKAIYNHAGITRGQVWAAIGKGPVREDSADADLFKLLFRDLSTGGIIRQHRDTDAYGNFIKKARQRGQQSRGPQPMKSAFDDDETYELTQLGDQFVHYAMTDVPVKIEYKPEAGPSDAESPAPHTESPAASNDASAPV